VPVERGCDSEGYLEMVDGLVSLALGTVNLAKNAIRIAGPEFSARVKG
jgi:hypothetical protein